MDSGRRVHVCVCVCVCMYVCVCVYVVEKLGECELENKVGKGNFMVSISSTKGPNKMFYSSHSASFVS